MKNTQKVRAFAILLFLLLTAFQSFAQVSESKQVIKEFPVSKGTIVDIENKYGDITISTWDKELIWVQIDYTVTEKSRDRLASKLREINFELKQSGHYVVINTKIGSSKNILLEELEKLKQSFGVGESQVEIHMQIKMPDKLDLRITNKFGNIYLDDYRGEITLDLSNGRLKAHDLMGYTNMKINFGDAIINSIDSGNLEVYYSEMNLSSARRLRINSKTSDITITEVAEMLVTSSRDDYRIRMIKDFETEANWTDFSITEFSNKSDIRMNYGDLTIENIRPSVESIIIDAKSTNINLYFDREVDVNFDITTNKDLNLPMEAVVDSTEQLNEKEKIMRILGRTGEIKKGAPKLILNTTSAEINILKK